MQIAYFHVAADVPEGPDSSRVDAAVVIDVLRATTTIAWALHNGAEAVQTFSDLDELRTAAAAWPAGERLLVGERGGQKLEGFDLGNSPVAVVPELVQGKRLFMSTTNGTRSLQRVRDVARVFTAALPNRQAVADRLLAEPLETVWIVGSGWEGSYSLEDSLAAGALASLLIAQGGSSANDEMEAALALWNQWQQDPEACLRKATHGQRLIGLGNHDADFRCCAGLDGLRVVPTQVEPGVLRAV
ncbi:MAG: 2-phosphosulfolactate phosphatase family protein [Synechococcaceae bacterium WB9_4xC_028]|jgi:2-phosphosulfolactate phosphatase|nr:2-phosphosulfolactate phosphatase family protein [Synechococcaceae bacterium WB9_4xC_028]